jgi:hypothetical protein
VEGRVQNGTDLRAGEKRWGKSQLVVQFGHGLHNIVKIVEASSGRAFRMDFLNSLSSKNFTGASGSLT